MMAWNRHSSLSTKRACLEPLSALLLARRHRTGDTSRHLRRLGAALGRRCRLLGRSLLARVLIRRVLLLLFVRGRGSEDEALGMRCRVATRAAYRRDAPRPGGPGSRRRRGRQPDGAKRQRSGAHARVSAWLSQGGALLRCAQRTPPVRMTRKRTASVKSTDVIVSSRPPPPAASAGSARSGGTSSAARAARAQRDAGAAAAAATAGRGSAAGATAGEAAQAAGGGGVRRATRRSGAGCGSAARAAARRGARTQASRAAGATLRSVSTIGRAGAARGKQKMPENRRFRTRSSRCSRLLHPACCCLAVCPARRPRRGCAAAAVRLDRPGCRPLRAAPRWAPRCAAPRRRAPWRPAARPRPRSRRAPRAVRKPPGLLCLRSPLSPALP